MRPAQGESAGSIPRGGTSLRRRRWSTGVRAGEAPADIQAAARARTAPLDPASITVVARYYDSATATFVAWPETGVPPNSPPRGVLVRIDVSYPWSAASFVAGRYFSATGTRTLNASSTMETRR